MDKPPVGEEWLHEIKFDGYRLIALIKNKKIRLLTRRGNDWSDKFPFLVDDLKTIPVSNAILDGELIAFDKKGISNFQILQNAIHDLENMNKKELKKIQVQYTVFDLPYCEGFDLSKEPLIERKAILKAIFQDWKISHPHITITNYMQGKCEKIYKEACRHHLEGIISKNRLSNYVSRRSHDWLKIKCHLRQEFVIGGMTKPQGARKHLGALLLGYYNKKGELTYCGRVGTGFTEVSLQEISKKLAKCVQSKNPFNNLSYSYKLKGVTWLKPKLVCEVEFSSWTNEGILRHPAFLGLRLDKIAKDVVKEEALKKMKRRQK